MAEECQMQCATVTTKGKQIENDNKFIHSKIFLQTLSV